MELEFIMNLAISLFKWLVVILALSFSTSVMAGTLDKETTPEYRFYHYQVDAGLFNQEGIYINKYLTWPYLPVFWQGKTQAKNGFLLSFQDNLYHSRRWFSLDWGISTGHYLSSQLSQSVNVASIFLAIKFWLIRTERFNFYFMYSPAGPTYCSQQIIDNQNMYSKFTFQDFIGIGAFIGKRQALDIGLKVAHYSNGLLVPQDPGFDVPILVTIGYAF